MEDQTKKEEKSIQELVCRPQETPVRGCVCVGLWQVTLAQQK